MASLTNGAIPFFVGVFVLLWPFRIVGKKPGEDPKFDAWHARFGVVLKVWGGVAILLAVFYVILDTRPG